MSKIKALITVLVLGSSSVAMADTGLTFHAQASWGSPSMTAPVVRDHRWTAPAYEAPVAPFARGTWISLAEPMYLGRGRTFIDLDTSARLNQIRLQSAAGQAFISTVTVQYVNGASQVETLNQWIDARNPMAQFNLNRTAQVDSIIINGSRSQRGGRFQVFGYASSTRPTPPIYQPERPPVYQPPVYQAPRQVVIASAVNFARTDGYRTLSVNESARFNTLRLEGVSGQTFISKIEVQFTNGQTQSLYGINRTLLPGQALNLSLNGLSPIRQVIVFTNDTLTPVANHITGEFTVSAL